MDVVLAVSVAVCAVELVTETDVGERLQVTGLVASEGDVVTAQVRSTVPLNELAGVTVIVDVLPEVAPGLTEIAPLLEREKLEPAGFQKPLQPVKRIGSISTHPARTRLVAIIPNLRVQGKLLSGSIHPQLGMNQRILNSKERRGGTSFRLPRNPRNGRVGASR